MFSDLLLKLMTVEIKNSDDNEIYSYLIIRWRNELVVEEKYEL
jgi:hypothetical protein